MSLRPRVQLVPLIEDEKFDDALSLADDCTLGTFLGRYPALSTTPLDSDLLNRPLAELIIIPSLEPKPGQTPLYRPSTVKFDCESAAPSLLPTSRGSNAPSGSQNLDKGPAESEQPSIAETLESQGTSGWKHPQSLNETAAVLMAYGADIEQLASYVRQGLSVLVQCDKLLVPHLHPAILQLAGRTARTLSSAVGTSKGLLDRGQDHNQLKALKEMVRKQKSGEVLVLPNLDLLAGGRDGDLSARSKQVIETLFDSQHRQLLAFSDPSLHIPEVLAKRFAIRKSITGLGRMARLPSGEELPVAAALVEHKEAAIFKGFDPQALYKNIAGMNAIRFRHAMAFARAKHSQEQPVPVARLYETLRAFKAQTSEGFAVPDVSLDDIGGYLPEKEQVLNIINLQEGAYQLPDESLRHELVPRGLIFHGPPGTGKTLFAKAIANRLNATIQVVSGPEVTDMYVGESERKIRHIFEEGRRNAPAVIVFDEFDSIAHRRAGRQQGGTRAGNAVVAQILTEMDGFRPDVPLLVVGTTNRIDIIDEALLRPSRFLPISIGLPDRSARLAIARVHNTRFQIGCSEEILNYVASSSEGLNGDQIRSIFRDLCVARYCKGRSAAATNSDIDEAISAHLKVMSLYSQSLGRKV